MSRMRLSPSRYASRPLWRKRTKSAAPPVVYSCSGFSKLLIPLSPVCSPTKPSNGWRENDTAPIKLCEKEPHKSHARRQRFNKFPISHAVVRSQQVTLGQGAPFFCNEPLFGSCPLCCMSQVRLPAWRQTRHSQAIGHTQ